MIHKGCPGSGVGPVIDGVAWMKRLLMLANREFDKNYKIIEIKQAGDGFVIGLE